MPVPAPSDPKLKQRIAILTQAVAAGKPLQPQHQAEYDNYVKMGLAQSASPPPMPDNQKSDYDELLNTIKGARDHVDWWDSGFGAETLAKMGGTSAHNLSNTLTTIKANLAFDKLQEMRNASKTGGALGQVSDTEEKMLSSAVAALDLGQSQDQLKANLEKVKKHYMGYVKSLGYDIPDPDKPKPAPGADVDAILRKHGVIK